MHCADFRSLHLSWLDADLAPRTGRALRDHAGACPRCARYDAAVRLGLLLARHHAPIRPSRAFRRGLAQRLAAETGRSGAAILRPYGALDPQSAQGDPRKRPL